MISTQTLYLIGMALVGWLIRHYLPPASAAVAGGATSPLPVTGVTNPIVSALLQQGSTVIESALHDWLANGLPQNVQPGLPAAAQHPLVAAASQVAAQAGQNATANVMAAIQAALAQAQPTK